MTPERSLQIEDEEYQKLLKQQGKLPTATTKGIPKFFKPLPGPNEPLKQKLREESWSNLLSRKTQQLLDRNELNDLWNLLNKHQTSQTSEEPMITYTDYQVGVIYTV